MAAKKPNEFGIGIHPRNMQYKNDTLVAFSTQPALSAIAMSLPSPSVDSHSCDTLPPARLSSPSPAPTVSSDHWSSHPPSPSHPPLDLRPSVLSQPGHRKLCVRHQRIADEGTNLKLQQVRPPLSFSPSHPVSYYVSWCPLISCLTRDFFPLCPRPSMSFPSAKENLSMQSGPAFRHRRIRAESLFFGAS